MEAATRELLYAVATSLQQLLEVGLQRPCTLGEQVLQQLLILQKPVCRAHQNPERNLFLLQCPFSTLY